MNLAFGCAVKCPASDLGPAMSAGSALCACEAARTKEAATPTRASVIITTDVPTSTSARSITGSGTGTGTPTGSPTTGTPTGSGIETTTLAPTTAGPACVPSNLCDAVRSKVPSCAHSCIGSAAQAAGCNTDNLSCQVSEQDMFWLFPSCPVSQKYVVSRKI